MSWWKTLEVTTHPPDRPEPSASPGPSTAGPLYRRLARKEARLREDQYVALSRLVRVLARRRTDRSGPRLTENTLIRIAIDLLLSRADYLIGNTESELRASVLPMPRTHQPESAAAPPDPLQAVRDV
jgi:hypothetical protein